ncbi:UNKNOWN [Stylonychia lemnae]|uniref:Transmembrane protein n=1 Tax=Stylonychia lemnae TaxID=5949 RepID=A0A078ANX9_STYLE|nr:UNKNOWN [Stylonychia lemnae]|eukprot:CDW83012.1 UNKNOWN [Stylonychia lemnae]
MQNNSNSKQNNNKSSTLSNDQIIAINALRRKDNSQYVERHNQNSFQIPHNAAQINVTEHNQPDDKNSDSKKIRRLRQKKQTDVGQLGMAPSTNVLLALLIIVMGFKASQYNFNDLLVVDKALMALGIWVLLISLVNLYGNLQGLKCSLGLGKESDEIMLFVLYNCVISFILLSIFAIGAISFSDNLDDWIGRHWDEIRQNVQTYSMTDFKQHVASELVSLGAFAFTIDLSLFIMISTILLIQGVERVMIVLFPLTNLIFIIFSMAIFAVAFNFNSHSYYSSAMPMGANYALFVISIFVFIIGVIGYKSSTTGKMGYLQTYILVLAFSALLSAFTGVFMILKTATIKDTVNKEWDEIQERLKSAGYDIEQGTFSNFLEVNLKFGGLFLIVFCLFLILGLVPVYIKFLIKRRGETQHKGTGGGTGIFSTPYRLNSDQTSPKLRRHVSPNESEA